jgi:hypothetical protein
MYSCLLDGVWTRFIDHLCTQLIITCNYNTIADFDTINHSNPSLAFISLYLVTALKKGYSSEIFSLGFPL